MKFKLDDIVQIVRESGVYYTGIQRRTFSELVGKIVHLVPKENNNVRAINAYLVNVGEGKGNFGISEYDNCPSGHGIFVDEDCLILERTNKNFNDLETQLITEQMEKM